MLGRIERNVENLDGVTQMRDVIGFAVLTIAGIIFYAAFGMALYALGGPILLGAFALANVAAFFGYVAEALLS